MNSTVRFLVHQSPPLVPFPPIVYPIVPVSFFPKVPLPFRNRNQHVCGLFPAEARRKCPSAHAPEVPRVITHPQSLLKKTATHALPRIPQETYCFFSW
ncbi:hypothetical protein JTE90_006915 [Oedothorax gibbosus]|uniref:Uncharacterized protein n=1 Tax=Oedothorax gibbosus TaxID=931172 RepID=A0AAV6VNB8_9ARAC|nr:hypothetical protein JTE90_006915 [Oedothorax gibbosus]